MNPAYPSGEELMRFRLSRPQFSLRTLLTGMINLASELSLQA